MKKILPKILNSIFTWLLVLSFIPQVYGSAVPFPSPDVPYTEDPEVNFVGKTDARAVQFLNWTLQNYEWACYVENIDNTPVNPDPSSTNTRKCDNSKNPLIAFWVTIRNIIYALFALIVLATAFVLMATRGKSLTLKRFLPRFVAVVLLVTLSYALIQIIYTTFDLVQGFFLTKPATGGGPRQLISAVDLLYVGWDYEFFRGLRKVHPYFDEAVFVNLLLARLTAVTYYAMSGVLIIRKIILWFFIVLSPVFPILLLYYPVRNTAKIWIGEFFRWLLYAPLFSIFLSGLVSVWKSPRLPLIFDFKNVGTNLTYPTATNVLLGGPGQVVTANNNINTPDTFALYVVALIMLWVVILLPFILLQIFLDYLNNFSFEDSPAMQKLINTSYLLMNKTPPSPLPIPPAGSTGMTKQLPFAKYSMAKSIPIIQEGPIGDAKQMPLAVPIGEVRQVQTSAPISMAQAMVNTEILNATNISLPTIRDIASYERQIIAKSQSSNVSRTNQTLMQLGNPASIQNEIEREKFTQLKEKLVNESRQGNQIAGSILSAVNVANNISNISNVTNQNIKQVKNLRKTLSNIANPTQVTAGVDRENTTKMHESLVKESRQGNTLATTMLAAKESTTIHELQNIKDQLTKESIMGNNTSTAILATSFTKEHESVLKNVLSQVANPVSVTSADKEKITQMHDSLIKESQQGNTLATSILSTKETATSNEIHDMKEKLIEATLAGNQNAANILSTAITRIDSTSTQKVIQQLANPATITNNVTKEKFEKVKESLIQARSQGNQFATSMLSNIDSVSSEEKNAGTEAKSKEMELIKSKLLEAKEKGEPLAADVLSLFTAEGSVLESIPALQSNRVQQVSSEDFEAVKKMWQENYSGMDVPEGLTSRKEWVKDEISDIDNILELLRSNDTEKITQGMQEVGNVLPFLMLGGFSQQEIISYLEAKRDAGKSVIEDISKEDDTLLTVDSHTATTQAAMSQAVNIDEDNDDKDTSLNVNNPATDNSFTITEVNPSTELIQQEKILQQANLSLPTMLDITRYDQAKITKNSDSLNKIEEVKSILRSIDNPQAISDSEQKAKVIELKQQLLSRNLQGDIHATAILAAAKYSNLTDNASDTEKTVVLFRQYLLEIANPFEFETSRVNEVINKVHSVLEDEKQKHNLLAEKVFSVTKETPADQILALRDEIYSESEAGNPLAQLIWQNAPKETILKMENNNSGLELPQQNTAQIVSVNDYETVRGLWQDFYGKSDEIAGIGDKKEWLSKEIENINSTLNLLSSSEKQKVQLGLTQVSNLLPFVLLGGFTLPEIISYLNAKLNAASSVMQNISNDNSTSDDQISAVNKSQNDAHMAISNEE